MSSVAERPGQVSWLPIVGFFTTNHQFVGYKINFICYQLIVSLLETDENRKRSMIAVKMTKFF